MGILIHVVDAFTREPFSGNPAAVCLLDKEQDDAWMQNIAQEMKHSETAFVVPAGDDFKLRWFTPTTEVDLCGHATLASAHVLWEMNKRRIDQPVRFHTLSGLLTATRNGDWIEMNFPATPPEQTRAPAELVEALEVTPIFVGKSKFDYLVEISSEEFVRQFQPDIDLLTTFPTRGVIVTSRAPDKAYDFVSRFFAPAYGVEEDPVTGSAHCCLGPYWQKKLGKREMLGYQASRRGGFVKVRMHNDRVCLGGQAVTVMRGELI